MMMNLDSITHSWEKFYDESARKHGNTPASSGWWKENYFNAIKTVVLELIEPERNGWVADVGCGPGLILKPFIPPLNVIGVDLSKEMLIHAKNNFLLPVKGDCLNLPLRSGSCEQAICVGVLQCFQSPVTLVHELTRITTPGGIIIVVTHNSQSVIRKLAPKKGFKYLHSKQTIENLFEKKGFYPTTLRAILYPSLKPKPIHDFNVFYQWFCTTLIWKFSSNHPTK